MVHNYFLHKYPDNISFISLNIITIIKMIQTGINIALSAKITNFRRELIG